MSGTNDFQTVAAAPGANVVTQAQYLALTSLLADGLTSGIVASDQLNKILRQGSIMSAVIGQLIADSTGQNATDDGTIATLESNLAAVIRGAAITAPDTGTANAYAISLSPAPIALTPGMLVQIDNIVGTNTGASTLNVNGLGTLPIQSAGGVALQGGELVATYGALLRLNHAMTAWILLQTTGGSLPVKAGTQSEHSVNLGQFTLTGSLNNGTMKFPNGFMINWASASASVTSGTQSQITANWYTAFPNRCIFSMPVSYNPSGSNKNVFVSELTAPSPLSQATAAVNSPTQTVTVFFLGFGN